MIMFICSCMILLIGFMVYFCLYFFLGWSLVLNFSFMNMFIINMNWAFLLDMYSVMFMCVILIISFSVVIYSYYYMNMDFSISRFLILLILFVISMMLVVGSPNILCLMLGWDGLGLTSFCLIIFYQNNSSMSSGLLTIFMNRVGDIFMMLSIFLYVDLLVWDLIVVDCSLNVALLICVFVACMTKSAQFPFMVWLPAAMSAPTPISALVHSSTLVTVGVYILIRYCYLFMQMTLSLVFLIVGLFTMIMSGVMALVENDLSKIIAMSTLSQLGFMMFMLSLGEMDASYFHMLTHALFKSSLFLTCGGVLIMNGGSQDVRLLGGFLKYKSSVFMVMLMSCISMMGFPFMSGFYSKDLILEKSSWYNLLLFAFMLYIFGCCVTVMYSIRIMYYITMNMSMNKVLFVNEKSSLMFSLIVLFYVSLFMGKWLLMMFMCHDIAFYVYFDKLMGMFIMMMGIMIIFIKYNMMLNMLNYSFYELSYLTWVSVKFLVNKLNSTSIICVSENTWLEIMPHFIIYSWKQMSVPLMMLLKQNMKLIVFFSMFIITIFYLLS